MTEPHHILTVKYRVVMPTFLGGTDLSHAELPEWAGEDFDPEAFDINAVNETLGSLQ